MSMVKETRIIFELADIAAVRIQHKACGGEIVQYLGDTWAVPQSCPCCRREWSDDMDDDLEYNAKVILENRFKAILKTPAGVALVRLLEDALGIDSRKKAPVNVRFELEGTSMEKS